MMWAYLVCDDFVGFKRLGCSVVEQPSGIVVLGNDEFIEPYTKAVVKVS